MNKVNVIKQNLEFIGKTWIKYIGTFASILSLFFLFWTWDDIRITSTQYKCVIIILLCVLRGKVPTKYFVKRFYGVEDTCEILQEEGKEWFHA